MRTLVKVSVALLSLAATMRHASAAEESSAKPLELAQIFGPGAITLEHAGAFRWLPGGDAYSRLEKAADSAAGMDVVRYDVATGKRSVIASASALSAPDDTHPLSLTDHEWSPDGRLLLLRADHASAR